MVPKVIHYCWFGGNEKPDIIKKCIQSWREKCPDYEIKEWNESNFDVTINRYMYEAYQNKKWGFVPDYARAWIIYHYGGIYMDTDVELLDNMDSFLNYDSFMFWESEIFFNLGMGFGAEKGNQIIKAVMDEYENRAFIKPNGKLDMLPSPAINTKSIRNTIPEIRLGNYDQIIDNNAFLSYSAYSRLMKHYGTATWTDKPNLSMDVSQKVWKDTKLKRFLRKPSRLEFVENHFPKKLYNAYIFFSYDFLEFGGKFFIKKYVFRK